MGVLMIGLLARLVFVLPASYPFSVSVVRGPVRCESSANSLVVVSGRVSLVGRPLTGNEAVGVQVVRAGQLPTGEVVTSDLVTGLRVDKDGKYGPVERMGSGLILTASALGFESASVMVRCSSTVDFVLVASPSPSGGAP